MKGRERKYPLRLALYYALFSGAYILLSDRLLEFFIPDPSLISRLQTYKGWVFVALSAWLIHSVVSHQLLKIAAEIREREQVEENQRQHIRNLDLLHDVSGVLRSEEDTEAMLTVLLEKTLETLGTTAGTISLYNIRSGKLQYAVSRGWFTTLKKTGERPKEGIAGRVYTTGKPYIIRDFATDPLTRPASRELIPPHWGGVCVPFLADSQTVAVIFVGLEHPREISYDELKFLTSLSEMTGTALHKTLLYEETARRLRQLQGLRAIDHAITTSPEMHPTLKVLLNEVLEQLEVPGAAISLVEDNGASLRFAASAGIDHPLPPNTRVSMADNMLSRALAEEKPVIKDCSGKKAHGKCLFETHGEGYKHCINVPLLARGRAVGILTAFSRETFPVSPDWWSFLETLGGQAAIAIENSQMFSELKQAQSELLAAYDATIEGWAFALDLRDEETQGHSRRVTEATVELAAKLGFDSTQLVYVRRGAMLHDVGKMGIPDAILQKPGPLNEEEWVIMRKHPQMARDMLHHIQYLQPALAIPYSHHEKWDGTGYPQGLQGTDIPLEARVFAVVDVYDALTSDRPYRKAWDRGRALNYIGEQSGTHFDPEVVALFLTENPL